MTFIFIKAIKSLQVILQTLDLAVKYEIVYVVLYFYRVVFLSLSFAKQFEEVNNLILKLPKYKIKTSLFWDDDDIIILHRWDNDSLITK